MEKVNLTSLNPLAERVEMLKQLFPEAVREGDIDFATLRGLLGNKDGPSRERYTFSWTGKHEALLSLQQPSQATLLPVRDESVDFDNTRNIFIEGENLEVLKLLYKAYFGRVKMIYIDPPYNTGNDFVYPDNYADPLNHYLRLTGQMDDNGNALTSNLELNGRRHSRWLSMMYPRLWIAHQLLRDDGLIFVSIDDHEVHHLRLVMNEIFGEENFVACFVWKRRASSAMAEKLVSVDHEYVLVYQRGGFESFLGIAKDYASYRNPDNDPNGPWTLGDLTVGMTKKQRPNQFYDLVDPATGRIFPANPNRVWAFIPETMEEEIAAGRVVFPDDPTKRPMAKRYKKNLKSEVNPVSTWIKGLSDENGNGDVEELQTGLNAEGTRALTDLFGATVFNYSKPVSLLISLVQYCTHEDDLILDFFAGSCTSAQAILEANREDGQHRRFIMVQMPEPTDREDYPTIADIGKERIRRVIERMKEESNGKLDLNGAEDLGFRVYRLAPTLIRWDLPQDASPQEQLELMMGKEPLVPGWEPEALITEIALKECGYGLSFRVELAEAVTEQTVYRVIDDEKGQHFYICLDDKVTFEATYPLKLTRNDLFVLRDLAADPNTLLNLGFQSRVKTI